MCVCALTGFRVEELRLLGFSVIFVLENQLVAKNPGEGAAEGRHAGAKKPEDKS